MRAKGGPRAALPRTQPRHNAPRTGQDGESGPRDNGRMPKRPTTTTLIDRRPHLRRPAQCEASHHRHHRGARRQPAPRRPVALLTPRASKRRCAASFPGCAASWRSTRRWDRRPKPRRFAEGERLPYRGRWYTVHVTAAEDGAAPSVALRRGRFELLRSSEADAEAASARGPRRLRRLVHAASVLGHRRPRRLLLSSRTDAAPSDIRVRDMGRRWGTCNSRNGVLSFHWETRAAAASHPRLRRRARAHAPARAQPWARLLEPRRGRHPRLERAPAVAAHGRAVVLL